MKRRPLLGSTFLIGKNRRPLLVNSSVNTFPRKRLAYENERSCMSGQGRGVIRKTTWMGRTLLGNGAVNTSRPITHTRKQWKMSLREDWNCALLGNSAPMKTVARNHVTCFLCGLPYATIELGFLCVCSVSRLYKKQWRLSARIRQGDVVQGSSIVDVL
jgi:hypothetical protein